MATFEKLSDRKLRILIKRLSKRPTHNPEFDPDHCTQCRVLARAQTQWNVRLVRAFDWEIRWLP